jgi:hypothetical protein
MTMKKLIQIAAIVALTIPFAIPALAQSAGRAPRSLAFASDFQTLPVVGNVTGNGGVVFQTYVSLLNPTSSAMSIDATFYDTAGTPHNAVIALAAHELKSYDNFLDAVFHITGGGAVTLRGHDSNQRFIVDAEVWTAGSRYGTSIPALEFAGSNSPSFATGVTVSSIKRTNIGCFNQSDAANSINVVVRDTSGSLTLGSLTLNLPAHGWTQTTVSTVVNNGQIRFAPSDAAVCYAVVVDNATSDGRFIPAAEYLP